MHDHPPRSLQIGAAAAAALALARLSARDGAAAADSRSNCSRSTRSATSRCCTSPTCTAADAGLSSASRRAISASATRGAAAASHRQGLSRALRHSAEKSAAAYALTAEDFAALAQSYGRIGGLDRLATAVKAVRAERGDDRVLLLDGGDTWQGSLGANRTQGPGHGRLLQAAQARRHDRPLGIHLRRRAREGTDRQPRLSVPRAQCARHRMAGAGVRRLQDVREGRREDRRARARPSPTRRSPIRAG